MNMEELLSRVDTLMSMGETEEAEKLIVSGISECMQSGDSGALLQLLNEYLGFLRETGRYDESYVIAERIMMLSKDMGLKGSIPYATGLLNIANAYRAGGRLQDSLSLYDEVEAIYAASLPKDSLLVASFFNNKSLLYQELGEMSASIECLEAALKIVEAAGEGFEIAVTHANLANSYAGMKDYLKAETEATLAKQLFEKINVLDAHYASSLYILGMAHLNRQSGAMAVSYLNEALTRMEANLGKNEFYYRIQDALKEASQLGPSGMDICRSYYEEIVAPEIEKQFPDYVGKIAAGLVGRGSDCYGYDDALSRDHDWGPGCLLFVTGDTYDRIGEALQKMYDALPSEYMGYKRGKTVSKHKRRGVFIIEEFYKELLGLIPTTWQEYAKIPDYALSSAVNGEVFKDDEGEFSRIRESLKKGYPEKLQYLKIAEAAATFSQCAQYNVKRMLERKDTLTANLMLADGMKASLKLAHYFSNVYPPHDKWLRKSVESLPIGIELLTLINRAFESGNADPVGEYLAGKMYEAGFISDTDDYLDHHTEELLVKADLSEFDDKTLAEMIAKLEFEAFDKVQNEGGRASCQNDWYTFSKMRVSQYYTWNRAMLLQYYYDFQRELSYGHNLITEKYGRMMISTAPMEYEKIKDNFPVLTDEKKKIIEAVCAIQVTWMEDFSEKYPKLSGNARSIHTSEDRPFNTSYETYLRGELGTYSDKMLELYGKFIAMLASEGRNLAFETMENSVKLYGYGSLDEAEAAEQ